jgi:hypothetical protein
MIKRASEGDWFWLSDKSASKQRRRKGRRRCAGLSRSVTVRERVGALELVDGEGEDGAWGDDFVGVAFVIPSQIKKKNGEDDWAATSVLPIDWFIIYLFIYLFNGLSLFSFRGVFFFFSMASPYFLVVASPLSVFTKIYIYNPKSFIAYEKQTLK